MNLAECLGVLDGEFESNILVGKGIVHASESLQLGLNIHLVLRVKVDLKGLGTINLVTDALANNLSRVADVLKDLLMDVCEGAGARAGSLLHGLAVEGLGKDGALGNNDNMLATELLLQLADKSGLDLVEVLKLSEGDEDDNSLAAATDLELLGSRDVKITEISLQLVGRHLKVEKLLRNTGLELIRLGTIGLHDFLSAS
mmetsp:Transcript_71692/g.108287  ORF Transcript_71692/g.108287 Transcript_71692/m.108287 type:complete len:200 (-) Transcript_71692:16-615(-)|eukprot:CAMPEP_0117030550 /NCGR_PEP_ID=MMETSP0472-20121206/22043_1 /TAXON_ID=693140 ORGANISM="Tiarina fusus, Strain LIS" /NCGR_SAMPLE_ID=MMETSP0472 /ASSEMBLY_ACC=CAM_ASM_000603 /LENGTH=199 /DNA_ID=CAMNT_0004738657 /DNA_START=64 /DNA_END=663 /DNA_ORIENTATION=-